MEILNKQDAELMLRAGELRNVRQQLETSGISMPRYPEKRKPMGTSKSVPYFICMVMGLLLWLSSPLMSATLIGVGSFVLLAVIDWNRTYLTSIVLVLLIMLTAARFIFLSVM